MPCLTRAIFLDRDGVLNRKAPEGEYVTEVQDFVLLPDVLSALHRLYTHGYRLFVVTNQRGLALGKLSWETLAEMHRNLCDRVASAGARIEQIEVCPHDFSDQCDCRKPRPGMILRLASTHHLDLANSWMIGDSPSDVEAGLAAGCMTGYIGVEKCPQASISAGSLASLVAALLHQS